MRQIYIRVGSTSEYRAIELAEGELLVLGREPEDPMAPPVLAAPALPATPVRIDEPSVSGKHALAWAEADALCIQDLGSTNGTRLDLPPYRTVRVEGDAPLLLDLAPPAPESIEEGPAAATWTRPADFAPAVAQAIADWLAKRRLPAQVRVSLAADPVPAHPGWIALEDLHSIEVRPVETSHANWRLILERIWKYVACQNERYRTEQITREEGFILASEAIRKAHDRVVQAARSNARSLLLLGPSGAGKEGLARAYHQHSRPAGAFVSCNCATFDRGLVLAHLFGVTRGAYTDAVARSGAVERASGGTLFLDEIAEMPAEVQPMLLRFLDRGEYERVGASGPVERADVRIVCATSRDLRAAAQRGEFRVDLWYRISVEVVEVPPLAERPADIEAYLRGRALSAGGSAYEALSDGALDLLLHHRWEGNFRELENFAMRLDRLVTPGRLSAEQCRELLEQGALSPPGAPAAPSVRPSASAAEEVAWSALAEQAAEAFVADTGRPPATWDHVKEYIEKYFKPLIFAHLSGAAGGDSVAALDVRALVQRLDADRGTVLKQSERYFERFVRAGSAPPKAR